MWYGRIQNPFCDYSSLFSKLVCENFTQTVLSLHILQTALKAGCYLTAYFLFFSFLLCWLEQGRGRNIPHGEARDPYVHVRVLDATHTSAAAPRARDPVFDIFFSCVAPVLPDSEALVQVLSQ